MEFNPHNYQKYAIDYIVKNEVAAILLSMGLGKTVITLTAISKLLKANKVQKVLVIAPLRVARNTWTSEIKKWNHLQGLTYSLVVGTLKERLEALNSKADIYIINRENVEWLVNKSNYTFDFDMVVIDELSSFKSHKSKRFTSLMSVRWKIKRIVGLTGTPCSNGMMDLWAQFKLLDYGKRLERYISRYREKYFEPDQYEGFIVYSWVLKPFAENQIYERISDISISMNSTDYLDMPELINNNVVVELDEKDKKLYKRFKNQMIMSLDGKEVDASNAATLSNKLIQMSNGAIYDEDKNIIPIHDKKLDALEDLIEQANGHPILVAYWFKHDRERIMKRFQVREILSDEDINDWNEGKIQVGLVQPQSIGHGINLQYGGCQLIWFSMIWSLELYQQTNARLWRQGQKSSVVIHHIICKDTIDESVIEALNDKCSIQDALINAVKAEVGK